jgi:hypothetical protein
MIDQDTRRLQNEQDLAGWNNFVVDFLRWFGYYFIVIVW